MNSPAAPSPSPLSVANRFALIIDGLRAAVAARIGYYAVTAPMIVYICNRLNRLNQRFQALAALIMASRLPPERVYRPRAAGVTSTMPPPRDPEPSAGRDFFPIWRLVPTHRFGWLCMVAPNWAGPHYAAAWGAGMRDLLTDPRMAALLAATPRMGELLRPLCWGLGIEASLLLAPRPPRLAPVTGAPSEAADADTAPTGGGGGGLPVADVAAPRDSGRCAPTGAAGLPDGGRLFAPA